MRSEGAPQEEHWDDIQWLRQKATYIYIAFDQDKLLLGIQDETDPVIIAHHLGVKVPDGQADAFREEFFVEQQFYKVARQWMRRLPEFRAEKDPRQFARDMGVEVSPDREQDFLRVIAIAGDVIDASDEVFGESGGN